MRESLTRAAVVRAARALLSSDGPSGLSLRRLAARLDVTAAALYAYVDNKGDLLQGVFQHEVESLTTLLACQEQLCPVERVFAMSSAYVSHACGNAPVFRTLFAPSNEVRQPHEASGAMMLRRAFHAALPPVVAGIEAGLLREQDPHMVHRTLWTSAHGTAATILYSGIEGAAHIREVSDAVLSTVLRGLCTPLGAQRLDQFAQPL